MKYPEDYINKVICGDCLEVMKGIPDKSIDLVLTDPPYESEAHTLQRRVKRGGGVMEIESLPFSSMDEQLRNGVAKEIERISKRWILTFCQIEASQVWRKAYEESGLVYKRTCIWVKPDGMPQYSGDRPGMGYETIVAMHTKVKSVWNGGGQHGVWILNKNDNGGKKSPHPTTKPRSLISKLVNLFSNEGDVVFDPFLGSGTTAVACKLLGRKYIGIEISPKYCEIANKRLAQEVLFK